MVPSIFGGAFFSPPGENIRAKNKRDTLPKAKDATA
jgi:hypothetical protein